MGPELPGPGSLCMQTAGPLAGHPQLLWGEAESRGLPVDCAQAGITLTIWAYVGTYMLVWTSCSQQLIPLADQKVASLTVHSSAVVIKSPLQKYSDSCATALGSPGNAQATGRCHCKLHCSGALPGLLPCLALL